MLRGVCAPRDGRFILSKRSNTGGGQPVGATNPFAYSTPIQAPSRTAATARNSRGGRDVLLSSLEVAICLGNYSRIGATSGEYGLCQQSVSGFVPMRSPGDVYGATIKMSDIGPSALYVSFTPGSKADSACMSAASQFMRPRWRIGSKLFLSGNAVFWPNQAWPIVAPLVEAESRK